MPNPKRRHSKTRGRKRRTHYKARMPHVSTCSNCGAPILSHHVCGECGFYRGTQVLEKKTAS